MIINEELYERINFIKSIIKEEYRAQHNRPWIIGFSGGKDSTLVLHLVIESLLELPRSERVRNLHVIANDTLVESPIVQSYVDLILVTLKHSLSELCIPIDIIKTKPSVNQTFWVNLIGRGYPAPTRLFRWCTDRMKIQPTTNYIKQQVSARGEVVLLLGVRRSESSARAASAKRYDNGERLNRHNDIPGCLVFRPILELSTDDVWEYLAVMKPPWGGSYRSLIELYRNAAGGDCPIVIDPDAQPSCGSSSIRFGCWTCTVVEKDKSFRNSMEKGFEELEPMANFRDWLKSFCYNNTSNRLNKRRNGQDGLGPLTFEARKTVLTELLDLQIKVGISLITKEEIKRIEEIWQEDASQQIIHQASHLLKLLEDIK